MVRRQSLFNDLQNLDDSNLNISYSHLKIPTGIFLKSIHFLSNLDLNSEINPDDVSLEKDEIEKLKEVGCDDFFIESYSKLVNKKRSKGETSLCCFLLGAMFGFLLKDCSPKQRELIKKYIDSQQKVQTFGKDRKKGGNARDEKYYKAFREHYIEKFKVALTQNPKLTANKFALDFYENPSMDIPYTPQNALNKLQQIARDVKKTVASNS